MCTPTLLTMTKVAATTMTAGSFISQGIAKQQQGRHANQVANYNARALENEAKQTRVRGVEEERLSRQRTAQLISKQRAQLGAASVEIDTGSALNIQEDVELLGEADAFRLKSNFERKAKSLEEQARITRFGGRAKLAAGEAAFTGSLLGAGGSLLGAGVADKWFSSDSAALT